MEKLSCDYLHHSIYLAPNELRHCCKRFFYDGKMQGDVKIFDVNKDEKISIDKIIKEKNKLFKSINNGEKNPCSGCPYLVKKNWEEITHDNFEIHHISVESTSVCSMKCTYCSEMYFGGLNPNYDVEKTLTKLLTYKTKDNEFELSWGGGEPTLLTNFDEIFENNTQKYKPTKNMIFSNALKYSKTIEKYLKLKKTTLVTSIDAGTPGMFKQIRGVKGIYKVLGNLKKYFENSIENLNTLNTNIIIKYIVTKENINDIEVNSFVNLIKEYNLVNCSFQISSDFKQEELLEDQTEKMLEFLIKLKNIGIKLAYFDYHSAPRIRYIMNKVLKDKRLFKSKLVNDYLHNISINSSKDIVVWGAGDTGRLIAKNNFFIKNKKLNIKYYVDKYLHSKDIKVQNKDIKSPETLLNNEYNILIASSAYYEEIYTEIISKNIPTSRILDQIYS